MKCWQMGRLIRAVALGAVIFATMAKAEIKNFTFQGTIIYVEDRNSILDGSITNGTPVQGFYIFDTTVPRGNTGDSTVGDYWFTNSTFGMVVKAGTYVFRTNPRHVNFLIELVNRIGMDNYLLRSYNNVCSQPVPVEHIAWQLDDTNGLALTNASLPARPPNLSAFQSPFGLTIEGECDSFFVRGRITSISEAPAAIPERPPVELGDAVEVRWQSRLGYFYQIQQSTDLDTWTDIGEPILGDGTVLSKFVPRQSPRHVFYRAEIANFSR